MIPNAYRGKLREALNDGGSETIIYVDSLETINGETLDFSKFTPYRGILTIDPYGEYPEWVSFTGINTVNNSFTGVTRGLSALDNTVVSGNKFFHAEETDVVLTWGVHNGLDIPAGGGGAVDSVNGQTGVVVLDADDIDDTSTTHKFVTAGDITKLENLSGTNSGDTMINVKSYGAVGDDSTDDFTAINNAINASNEGDIIYFPAGIYRVSQSLTLKRNRTYRGTHSPKWFYRGGDVCSIKPHSTFSGDQILYIPDKEITSESEDNDGGRIENICVNGNSFGTTLIGVRFHGLVRDWKVYNVDVSQTSGNSISCVGYTRVDTNTYYPRGFNFENVSTYSSGNNGGAGNGFVLNSTTDSTFTNCLAVGSESIGWLIGSPGETKFLGCRAVLCKSDGFRITGAVAVGGVQFIGCSTDRNGKYGFQITATGTQPIQLVGTLTRRDGSNTSGNPSGIGIIGTVGNKVCPVSITGLDQTIGFDDGGGGSESPLYGLSVEYAQHVQISGTIWGKTAPILNSGNVDTFDYSNCYLRTDTSGTITSSPLNSKTINDPIIDTIYDSNLNEILDLYPNTLAVNHLRIRNNATGVSPRLEAVGDDTNISINLIPKGTGSILNNGVTIPTISSTNTLTNKRITKRVVTTTDDATAVIDVDTTDVYQLSAIANNTTFSFTGTPTDGQTILIRFKDAGVSKTLTWTGFTAVGITLPTATTASKWHYIGVQYNSVASAWHAIAYSLEV